METKELPDNILNKVKETVAERVELKEKVNEALRLATVNEKTIQDLREDINKLRDDVKNVESKFIEVLTYQRWILTSVILTLLSGLGGLFVIIINTL